MFLSTYVILGDLLPCLLGIAYCKLHQLYEVMKYKAESIKACVFVTGHQQLVGQGNWSQHKLAFLI